MRGLQRSVVWRDPRVKPPFGSVEIDWGHPLASNLLAYYLCNEQGGNTVHDLVSSNDLDRTGTMSWDENYNSRQFPASYSTGRTTFNLPANISVVAKLHSSIPSGTFGSWVSNFTVSNSGFVLAINNSAIPYVAICDGFMGTTSAYVAETKMTLVGTGNTSSGTPVLYVDGVLQAGPSAATTSLINGGAITIGANPIGTVPISTSFSYVAIYSRILSQAEALWISFEPYAMLRPIVRRRWFVPSGVTPTDIPVSLSDSLNSDCVVM